MQYPCIFYIQRIQTVINQRLVVLSMRIDLGDRGYLNCVRRATRLLNGVSIGLESTPTYCKSRRKQTRNQTWRRDSGDKSSIEVSDRLAGTRQASEASHDETEGVQVVERKRKILARWVTGP